MSELQFVEYGRVIAAVEKAMSEKDVQSDDARQCYFAGMSDLYKVLMRLPNANLDSDAKTTITFTFEQFQRIYMRREAAELRKVRGDAG